MKSGSDVGEPITELLQSWQKGDRDALNRLVTVLHNELRIIALARLKGAQAPQTLISPTVLINEAFIKLFGYQPSKNREWRSRAEFFGLVSTMMMNFLLDMSRNKAAVKRGGNLVKVSLEFEPGQETNMDMFSLQQVLLRLEKLDAKQCHIWKSRHLCGLSITELAQVFEMGESTIYRELKAANGWVRHGLESA